VSVSRVALQRDGVRLAARPFLVSDLCFLKGIVTRVTIAPAG
jgi:hypothetical protein